MKKFKNKSFKKSFLNVLLGNNDTVKINEPKLVSKKPTAEGFFNQDRRLNNLPKRNTYAEHKHRDFESESGIYEEINLETYGGIGLKHPKPQIQNYMSGSLDELESLETENDYDFSKKESLSNEKHPPLDFNKLPSVSNLRANRDLNQKAFTNETYRNHSAGRTEMKTKLDGKIHQETNSFTFNNPKQTKTKNENNKTELLYEDLDSFSLFGHKDTTNIKSESPSSSNKIKIFTEMSNMSASNQNLNMKQNENFLKEETENNNNTNTDEHNNKEGIHVISESNQCDNPSTQQQVSNIKKSESFNCVDTRTLNSRFQSNSLMVNHVNETQRKPIAKKTNFENHGRKIVKFMKKQK